jgi:hypothetical protein
MTFVSSLYMDGMSQVFEQSASTPDDFLKLNSKAGCGITELNMPRPSGDHVHRTSFPALSASTPDDFQKLNSKAGWHH